MRWQKEKDPLTERISRPLTGITLLPVIGILAGCLTLCSFFLHDGSEGTGDVSQSVSYFEDFFEKNDAVAVFLGWGETE